jgi:hypothetical protein
VDQLPLFPELPVLPYAEALRDVDEIARGFQNDRGVQLIAEFQSCKPLQHVSEIFIKAASHVVADRFPRLFVEGAQVRLIEPPPGTLPPLL